MLNGSLTAAAACRRQKCLELSTKYYPELIILVYVAAAPVELIRLACRQEEQDPALIVVGRRSFGGFNAVAEKAYNACIRDIKAEERSGQMRGEGQGREAGGISDAEMAER